jgi:hypothetical protein
MRDVNADPAAMQSLSDGDRSAAPAERIKDNVIFYAAGLDDALQQRLRLLGWVPTRPSVPTRKA